MSIGEIIGLIILGLIVGALGRLVNPGRDPMGMLLTLGIGVASVLIVGWLLGGGVLGFIVAVIVAAILVTLVGQGLTLPLVLRRVGWDGVEPDGDEGTAARNVVYQAGLDEVERARPDWPGHQPLFDRLESGLRDRSQHLATEDPDETEERQQERVEHEEIQRGVIGAQRAAAIELRDRGEINDLTLRTIERELDFEELRMEG